MRGLCQVFVVHQYAPCRDYACHGPPVWLVSWCLISNTVKYAISCEFDPDAAVPVVCSVQ